MSRVGEMGVGEMGIGETGVGEMGVGETGPNQRNTNICTSHKHEIWRILSQFIAFYTK